MGMYEEEKSLMGKTFIVIRPWKIGRYKMKKGNLLKVVSYGSGITSHYIVFENERLSGDRFRTATWMFLNRVERSERSFEQ